MNPDRDAPSVASRTDGRWHSLIAIAICLAFIALAVGDWIFARRRSNLPTPALASAPDAATADTLTHGALIVPDGATNVAYQSGASDSIHVSYTILDPYPAANSIQRVSNVLQVRGWKPLQEDWLNPGMPSSHVRGWTQFQDRSSKPERQVQQWLAQWANPNGDVVNYSLRYVHPLDGKPNRRSLSVSISWFPADTVKTMQAGAH